LNHNSVFSILLVLLVCTSTISVASGQLVTFDLQEKNILDFKKIDEQTNQQEAKLSYKIGLAEQFEFSTPGENKKEHAYVPPKLIKKISISEEMNFGPNNPIADSFVRLIKHNADRQAIIERISSNERIRPNHKIMEEFSGEFLGLTEIFYQKDSQLGSDAIDPILLVHHANKISEFNKIGNEIGFEALTFGLVNLSSTQLDSFYKLHEDLSKQVIFSAKILVDIKNPTLLLFLVPFASFVLIRFENDKIKTQTINKFFTYSFLILITFSAISTPISIGSSYWGLAYAEEITNSFNVCKRNFTFRINKWYTF